MMHAGSDGVRGLPGGGVLHVGIVHGKGSIHFVAAAETRDALMLRLGEYVRRHAEVQLYPGDAARLARMLDDGEVEAAVRFYFARVGTRWEREWLDEGTLEVATAAAA